MGVSKQVQLVFVYIAHQHILQQRNVTFNVITQICNTNLSQTISKMRNDPILITGIFYSVYAALLR